MEHDAIELLPISDLAAKWGVDTTIIRTWCKTGRIPFKLVGANKVRYVSERDLAKPIPAPDNPISPFTTNLDPYRFVPNAQESNDEPKQLGQGTASEVRSGADETAARRDANGAGRSTPEPEVTRRGGGTPAGAGTSQGRSERQPVNRSNRR